MSEQAPKFEKIGPQKYAVAFNLTNGKPRRIIVQAEQVGNPSARGGAYMTRWVAFNGGMYLREHGETRQEAFDKAWAVLVRAGKVQA